MGVAPNIIHFGLGFSITKRIHLGVNPMTMDTPNSCCILIFADDPKTWPMFFHPASQEIKQETD